MFRIAYIFPAHIEAPHLAFAAPPLSLLTSPYLVLHGSCRFLDVLVAHTIPYHTHNHNHNHNHTTPKQSTAIFSLSSHACANSPCEVILLWSTSPRNTTFRALDDNPIDATHTQQSQSNTSFCLSLTSMRDMIYLLATNRDGTPSDGGAASSLP